MKLKPFKSQLLNGKTCHSPSCALHIPKSKHAKLKLFGLRKSACKIQIGGYQISPIYKTKPRESNQIDFYRNLDWGRCQNIIQLAMFSIFGRTYKCKQTFCH